MTRRPRVLVANPDYFEAAIPFLRVHATVRLARTAREVDRALPWAEGILLRVDTVLDEGRIARAAHLRAIASATTGLDHIALASARARGIRVLSLRADHSDATAEHAIALLFACARRVVAGHARVAAGGFRDASLFGRGLAGARLGIVGLGRIGRRVAAHAAALGMRVSAYDPYLPDSAFCPFDRAKTLRALLRRSDVLSLHVPLTEETRGMIGARELGAIPRGAILVNTARAEVVDSRALLAALDAGRLFAAAVDVFSPEPPRRGDPLVRYARRHPDRLVLTPHLGASTRATVARVARRTARRLLAALGSTPAAGE